MNQFDVIVIGSGPAGYTCAIRAAQLGLTVACVEYYSTLGGTCLNVGCIPSKALLQSSENFFNVKHKSADHGIEFKNVEMNIKKMMERKSGVVTTLTKGIEGLFKKNKITWLRGRGQIAAKNTVKVVKQDGNTEEFSAKNIVIATGSKPIELKIAPFDDEFIVSSTHALGFSEVPKHLVVIGAGVIGLELGSVWLRLGAKVTVVEAQDKIFPQMDQTVSRDMQRILTKQGFEFLLQTKLLKCTKNGKKISVETEKDGQKNEISCDRVLVAVGRKAYTEHLGLANVGITVSTNGKVGIDKHFRTTVPNIYAIGDVVEGLMLAHKADEEGVACAEIIAGFAGHVNYEAIPNVIYTWPEVATVGLTEQECKDKNINYKIGQYPFVANGRAKCMGETDGFVKIIADAKTDRMLGAHIVGPTASELIAELVLAMEYKASAEDIARTCHAHPTLSEVIKEAALGVDKRSINI